MITISLKTLERLCAAAGKAFSAASAAIVSTSGDTAVVDESHREFPKARGCGCCGQARRNKK